MRHTMLCLLFAVLLFLTACGGPGPTPLEGDMENVYGIVSSTVLHYDDTLSVAAGNFWREAYVDEQGATRSGPTAGLWITLNEATPQMIAVRVHVGQELTVGQYTIRVVEIGQEDGTPSVRLAIQMTNASR